MIRKSNKSNMCIATSRFSPAAFLLAVHCGACALLALTGGPANAQFGVNYTLYLYQNGPNVDATGSGYLALFGLYSSSHGPGAPYIDPQEGALVIGLDTSQAPTAELYGPIVGPPLFGLGPGAAATTSSGPIVGIQAMGPCAPVPCSLDQTLEPGLVIPPPRFPFQEVLNLVETATWDNTTLSALGVTNGVYVWTWGADLDQSLSLFIGINPPPHHQVAPFPCLPLSRHILPPCHSLPSASAHWACSAGAGSGRTLLVSRQPDQNT